MVCSRQGRGAFDGIYYIPPRTRRGLSSPGSLSPIVWAEMEGDRSSVMELLPLFGYLLSFQYIPKNYDTIRIARVEAKGMGPHIEPLISSNKDTVRAIEHASERLRSPEVANVWIDWHFLCTRWPLANQDMTWQLCIYDEVNAKKSSKKECWNC
jgi:hypothetical protein